jgi:hypothetical protein
MSLKASVRLLPALALAAAALSGCMSGMTYGTGTTPGRQTVEDIVGIADFSGKKQPVIDYAPRPPVVVPPSTATLPPPEDKSRAVAANWPNDPDAAAAKRKAAFDASPVAYDSATIAADPKFRLPQQDNGRPHLPPTEQESAAAAITTPAQAAAAKKLFADARPSGGSVDANGNPVRKYLIEPPPAYRAPDPTAPTEIVDKPKAKFKPPWAWWSSN